MKKYKLELKALLTGIIVYVLALVVSSTLFSCEKQTYAPITECRTLQAIETQQKFNDVWVSVSFDTIGFVKCSDTTGWEYINNEIRTRQTNLK